MGKNDSKTAYWVDTFRKIAPDIPVYSHNEDHRSEDIDLAVVSNHPPGWLSRYPNLKGVHAMGAGVEHLLQDKFIPDHVKLMKVVDPFLTQDMAEFALASMMSILRDVPFYKRAQLSQKWEPLSYRRIQDIKVGIMGLGTLGLAVAKKLIINGFKLCGWTRASHPKVDFEIFRGKDELYSFLNQCDALICLLPLTPATTGILNVDAFEALRDGAHVINLARGPVVVDDDLICALDSGKLSGALLDVFHEEPLPASHPFWLHEKVFITPHVASVTNASSVVPQILKNYYALKNGATVENEILRLQGY